MRKKELEDWKLNLERLYYVLNSKGLVPASPLLHELGQRVLDNVFSDAGIGSLCRVDGIPKHIAGCVSASRQ